MYKWRGRSITEVIVAVTLLGFLTGFVAVLCIGNYFRAKKAKERQRQRRISNLTTGRDNGTMDSPRSQYSGSTNSQFSDGEQHHLLQKGYKERQRAVTSDIPVRTQKLSSRRKHPVLREGEMESLLLNVDSQEKAEVDVMSV